MDQKMDMIPELMRIRWEDVTPYSPDERAAGVEPRTWAIKNSGLTIVVTRNIYHDPDSWVMNCHALRIENREMKSRDIKEAKEEAVSLVRGTVTALSARLYEIERGVY